MTNRSLPCIALAFAFAIGCMPTHDADVQKLRSGDCYLCHADVYNETPARALADPAIPDHLANATVYTQQCADCHNTTTWDSHPNALFPIAAGAHANVDCAGCHQNPDDNRGDAHGANTQCTACHPADEPLDGGGTMTTGHSDQAAFRYGAANFCLACHPTGVEKPHNGKLFPQDHGNARSCGNCHDRTKGSDAAGQNADCRRCHAGDLTRVGDHPRDVNTMPSPTGCLTCHRGGSHGGDGGG